MTLNLMLTSKDAVYLSGDFRLTSIEDQAALPDSFDIQKLIPVKARALGNASEISDDGHPREPQIQSW